MSHTLIVRRFFTTPEKSPYDDIQWEQRDAVISGSGRSACL